MGGDGTPLRDEGDALLLDAMEEASPADPFELPGGAYAEYGGRIAYTFQPRLTIEAIYTKAFRSASAMPRETRLDLRVNLGVKRTTLALTGRYAEYGSEPAPFYASFGPEGRAAQAVWILGGLGL